MIQEALVAETGSFKRTWISGKRAKGQWDHRIIFQPSWGCGGAEGMVYTGPSLSRGNLRDISFSQCLAQRCWWLMETTGRVIDWNSQGFFSFMSWPSNPLWGSDCSTESQGQTGRLRSWVGSVVGLTTANDFSPREPTSAMWSICTLAKVSTQALLGP